MSGFSFIRVFMKYNQKWIGVPEQDLGRTRISLRKSDTTIRLPICNVGVQKPSFMVKVIRHQHGYSFVLFVFRALLDEPAIKVHVYSYTCGINCSPWKAIYNLCRLPHTTAEEDKGVVKVHFFFAEFSPDSCDGDRADINEEFCWHKCSCGDGKTSVLNVV